MYFLLRRFTKCDMAVNVDNVSRAKYMDISAGLNMYFMFILLVLNYQNSFWF